MTSTRYRHLSLAGVLSAGAAALLALQLQPPPAFGGSAGRVAGAEGADDPDGVAREHQPRARKPTIVLVHGAFADGSSWDRVIRLLQADGFVVVAVQNPLTSLADDIKTTKRIIDAQGGPVVAVGHSYGGVVITGAAAGSANVKALVYVAAFAPEAGEVVSAPGEKFTPPALAAALVPDAAGFLYIDREKFHDAFCQDVPAADARVMAATQKPVHGSVFGASVPVAAWRTIPSWYVVSTEDRAINPDLERFYAKRIGATTTEIRASHVAFITHPREVARVIEDAASATAYVSDAR